MKTNKQQHHWLIDAALFIGFLLSFWLELAGVALHQGLGVALGAVAGYHLLIYWPKRVKVYRRAETHVERSRPSQLRLL